MVQQHVQADILRHTHGEVGVDEADERHVRQVGAAQNVIYPGAKGEHHFQVRQALQRVLRWFPDKRIADIRSIARVGPQADIHVRLQFAQSVSERVCLDPLAGNEKTHWKIPIVRLNRGGRFQDRRRQT